MIVSHGKIQIFISSVFFPVNPSLPFFSKIPSKSNYTKAACLLKQITFHSTTKRKGILYKTFFLHIAPQILE